MTYRPFATTSPWSYANLSNAYQAQLSCIVQLEHERDTLAQKIENQRAAISVLDRQMVAQRAVIDDLRQQLIAATGQPASPPLECPVVSITVQIGGEHDR
jgi:recombinational DNA repair ATPase RecF